MKRSEGIDCIRLKKLVNEIEGLEHPTLELLENLVTILHYYDYFRTISISGLNDFYFEVMRVAHEVLAEDYSLSAKFFENVLENVQMDEL